MAKSRLRRKDNCDYPSLSWWLLKGYVHVLILGACDRDLIWQKSPSLADVIKDLAMRLSWIIWLGLYRCPCERQKRQDAHGVEGHVTKEVEVGVMGPAA